MQWESSLGGAEPAGRTRVVGVVAPIDLPDVGVALGAHVTQAELRSRLPDADVRKLAPLAYLHPTPLDDGEYVEPLGEPTEERRRALADELAIAFVGPGPVGHLREALWTSRYGEPVSASAWFVGGLATEEDRCLVAWNAVEVPFALEAEEASAMVSALERRPYVSVVDEASRARLAEAGFTDAVVVPDPVVLAPRHLDADLLARRAAYLRLVGQLPDDGDYVLLHGDGVSGEPDAISASLRETFPGAVAVVLEGASDASELAAALAQSQPVLRLPAETGLHDIVTAVACGRATITSDARIADLARAFGHPAAPASGMSELRRGVDTSAALAAATGARRNMDALAELALAALPPAVRAAKRAAAARGSERRLDALATAHVARTRRLHAERLVFADRVADLERQLEEMRDEAHVLREAAELQLSRALEQSARAERDSEAWQAAERRLAEITGSRAWRYLGLPARRVGLRLRRRDTT